MRMSPIVAHDIGNCNNQLMPSDEEESVCEQGNGILLDEEDLVEIEYQECTIKDVLHGYIPDISYNPLIMEDDGEHHELLHWTYSDLVPNTPNTVYPHYNGVGLCLKRYVD